MTAAANAKQRAAKAKKIRQFVTPEGVDLELRIASAGLRFGALLVDLILINLVLLLFWLFTEWIGFASRSDITQVVWMLGAFLLRTFWFIGFELGSRAATPGKRLMGIRVVARDDADAHQPFARRRGARAELETDEPEGAQQEGAEHPHDLRNIGSRRESDPFGEQPKEQQHQIDQDQINKQRAEAQPRARDPEFEVDTLGRHELADLLRLRGALFGVGGGGHVTSSRRGM